MKSSCEVFALYFSSSTFKIEDFYATIIINIVFNIFLSYTAIMLNIVTIDTIRKAPSLPKTLKTLLLSLAVSDVGVGLLGQPLHISLLIMWLQQNDPVCNTYKGSLMVSVLFCLTSFFGVVAVSVDRFLAIHLHLRYQELVTHKRVVVVVILMWHFSAFFSSMAFWLPQSTRSLFVCIVSMTGLLVTTLVYFRIYLAVRRHKNQIHVLQVQNVAQTW